MSADSKSSKARRRIAVLLAACGVLLLPVVLMGTAQEEKPADAPVEAPALTIDEIRAKLAAGFASVESLAAVVGARADSLTARIEATEAMDKEMKEMLAAGAARPLEIRDLVSQRLEVVTFQMDSLQTAEFDQLNRTLDEIDSSLSQTLSSERARIHQILEGDAELIRFFHTHQDTINKAFLARIGQKPWYSTILSPSAEEGTPPETGEEPPAEPKPESEPPTPPGS